MGRRSVPLTAVPFLGRENPRQRPDGAGGSTSHRSANRPEPDLSRDQGSTYVRYHL